MKPIKRESFIFYKSFFEAIKGLPDNERLEMYDGIIKYAINGEKIFLDGFKNQLFCLIKPQLDANNKRYKDGKKGGQYGIKGGRPKNPTGDINNNPTGVTKITPKEKDKEKEKDNVKDTTPRLDFEKLALKSSQIKNHGLSNT